MESAQDAIAPTTATGARVQHHARPRRSLGSIALRASGDSCSRLSAQTACSGAPRPRTCWGS
eukprot:11220575-Lingulodinium_polyedra.AAC.1